MDIKKIIIGTGSYDTVKFGNCVSVTGDGGNAWGFYGQSYKKLAPKLKTYLPYAEEYEKLNKIKDESSYVEYRKKIEDEYINSYYETRLKDLDVYDLLSTLYNRFGDNIILLCHEPIDEFCHRRLIADYIELKTGIVIPEVIVDEDKNVREVVPINYKDRLGMVIDEDQYKYISDINELIKKYKTEGKKVKGISDGNHTFEEYIDMRNNLFIALCNAYPDKCWKSRRHYDEENDPMFNGDFIAGINTPEGVVTFHLKMNYWDILNVREISNSIKYDGYDNQEVYRRIKSLKR